MKETIGGWWMDASSNWHRGRPPAGWRQADDGRWRAPDDHVDDDPTGEIEGDSLPGPAHFGGGSPSRDRERGWGWPRWGLSAVLASLAIVAVMVAGAAAIIHGGPDQNHTGTPPTAEPGDAVSSSPGPQVSQTTSTVAASSSSDVVDPSASPSTEQASDTASTFNPSTTPAPPTGRPASRAVVRPGATCSPEGATAVTAAGMPLTCTVEKCHGAPFGVPRWRRASC